jgi:lipoate-protein ligase A
VNEAPWFLWQDAGRDAADNMAADEILLHHTQDLGVVLRFYQWQTPTISIGYFQPLSSAPEGKHQIVRRPTGGGVVDHRNDFTFSLVFPVTSPLYAVDRFESYRLINSTVAAALRNLSVTCHLHTEDIPKTVDRARMLCFQQPAKHDVVGANGKICGGAQRRRSTGMLHQGSIDLSRLTELSRADFGQALSCAFQSLLKGDPAVFQPSAALAEEIANLGQSRYASSAWTNKR